MTKQSYKINEQLGVAGPHKPVCLPATLEQLSSRYVYPPHVYDEYVSFVGEYETLENPSRSEAERCSRDGYDQLLQPLGGMGIDDAIFCQASTKLGWIRTVKKLMRQDYYVIADIGYGPGKTRHALGLEPTETNGIVRPVSNQVPKRLRGEIPLELIAACMFVGKPVNKENGESGINCRSFVHANILGIPKN